MTLCKLLSDCVYQLSVKDKRQIHNIKQCQSYAQLTSNNLKLREDMIQLFSSLTCLSWVIKPISQCHLQSVSLTPRQSKQSPLIDHMSGITYIIEILKIKYTEPTIQTKAVSQITNVYPPSCTIKLSKFIYLHWTKFRTGLSSFMHILKSYTANVSVFKCIRKGGIGLTNITVLNRVSSIISLEIALNKIFLLHAHPQVIFFNC